jgi:hypothetical protein
MINNLFRLLFTATLAVGAVVAVVGHSMQGGSDAKMVHTVQKKVDTQRSWVPITRNAD